MDDQKRYGDKEINIAELCELVRPGHRIFISSGPTTPFQTIQDMLKAGHGNLVDLEFIQIATIGNPFAGLEDSTAQYRRKSFIVGENISLAFNCGNVDFVPTNLAELPFLFVSGAVGVDVAIIQTSPPDRKGNVNLGVVNDIAQLIIERAPLVIAEINPNTPVTNGTTSIPLDRFDRIIQSSAPLMEFPLFPFDDDLGKIGWHVANLVSDGSTLSMGAGRIFDAISHHLQGKKDLRVFGFIISDWVQGLVESGAISKKKITERRLPVVAAACVGSRKFYAYAHKNPFIEFLPLLQSSYQSTLPKIKNLVSVINAKRIDLSGDSIVVPSQEYQIGGFDGKLSFSVAATFSRGGRSIVALKSVDKDGKSNIVLTHREPNEIVRSTLGSTRFVVTEYGIANVFGKSIRERALSLIDIAHPEHRKSLVEEAKEAGLLWADQIYDVEYSKNYPYELQTARRFKNDLEVMFRPIKPADEDMMRRLFYQFSSRSRFLRYFSPVRAMPHKKMQRYVNVDYDKTLSIVGLIHDRGIERIVAECRWAYDQSEDNFELAFVVDEEFQGKGIGRFMLQYLLDIATQRNINKLVAYVLPENKSMISILRKSRAGPKELDENGEKQFHFCTDKVGDIFQNLF